MIYLDNNATTACAPEVVAAMLPYFAEQYGNASSIHFAGRQAYRAIEESREKIASLLAIKPCEIFFNSGATEGNNWIFQAFAQAIPLIRNRIVVSAIEHKSVLDTASRLTRFGFDVQLLPVTADGIVDLPQAATIINKDTAIVSVQYANNETGVIQPIAELVEMAHAVGAFFHCDAVQGLGKAHLNLSTLSVDSAVFSAHKVHAPKGVGALYLRGGARRWRYELPLMGGGQEQAIRPGTYNVPGIVGFGKAAELIQSNLVKDLEHMRTLRDVLEARLKTIIPQCRIYGENAPRIPNTTNIEVPDVPATILITNMANTCLSEGSACTNGTMAGSHVLRAMHFTESSIENSVRISLSRYTTKNEIDILIGELCNQVHLITTERSSHD